MICITKACQFIHVFKQYLEFYPHTMQTNLVYILLLPFAIFLIFCPTQGQSAIWVPENASDPTIRLPLFLVRKQILARNASLAPAFIIDITKASYFAAAVCGRQFTKSINQFLSYSLLLLAIWREPRWHLFSFKRLHIYLGRLWESFPEKIPIRHMQS